VRFGPLSTAGEGIRVSRKNIGRDYAGRAFKDGDNRKK
jgi:hypothetical protein